MRRQHLDALTIVAIALPVLFACRQFSKEDRSDVPGASPPTLSDRVQAVVRDPQVIVDEELAVGASGWQSRGFEIPSERVIEVSVEGLRHTDKGFNLYVVSEAEADKFKRKEPFKHVSVFEGLKIRRRTQRAKLPPGSWHVVVHNSENILNTMVVHVRVVGDPR